MSRRNTPDALFSHQPYARLLTMVENLFRACLRGLLVASVIAAVYVASQVNAYVIVEAEGSNRAVELAIERGASG